MSRGGKKKKRGKLPLQAEQHVVLSWGLAVQGGRGRASLLQGPEKASSGPLPPGGKEKPDSY